MESIWSCCIISTADTTKPFTPINHGAVFNLQRRRSDIATSHSTCNEYHGDVAALHILSYATAGGKGLSSSRIRTAAACTVGRDSRPVEDLRRAASTHICVKSRYVLLCVLF